MTFMKKLIAIQHEHQQTLAAIDQSHIVEIERVEQLFRDKLEEREESYRQARDTAIDFDVTARRLTMEGHSFDHESAREAASVMGEEATRLSLKRIEDAVKVKNDLLEMAAEARTNDITNAEQERDEKLAQLVGAAS